MSSVESYLHLNRQEGDKYCHPAAERNKEPILQVLKKYLNPDAEGLLLEISSGSGQHVAHFAPHFPKLSFQPTEFDKSCIKSIKQYIAENNTGNIKDPAFVDVRTFPDDWLRGAIKPATLDYMLNINLMHISAWDCTTGLFKGAGRLLKINGILFTYGPFSINGTIAPQSNVAFDNSLREQHGGWGLRDVHRELKLVADPNGLLLEHIFDLPANNKMIVWRKTDKKLV